MKKILFLLIFFLFLTPITLKAQSLSIELDEVVCVAGGGEDDLITCNYCERRMTIEEWGEHDCFNDSEVSHCPFCNRTLIGDEYCNCQEVECVGDSSSRNENTGNGPITGETKPDIPNPSGGGTAIKTSYVQNMKAVNWLSQNAHHKSIGKCSKYVFNALDKGAGLEFYSLPRPRYAKDAGSYLLQRGYEEIPNTSTPEMGDIRVWQPYPRQKSQAGHIDMFDGDQWVSDFIEPQNTPGPGYRSNPDYKTYRRK